MKNKNDSTYQAAPTALYSHRLFRVLLHSTPVSRLLSFLGPQRCGAIIGRLLRPYVKPDKLNVLTVGRELFFKDIEQIAKRTDINFIPWRSGHLGRLQQGWTPKVCQRQGHFFPEQIYQQHKCWDKGKTLIKSIHETLEKRGDVPLVMSANVDYWQEEALRQYCTESGTPYLVLCRENVSMECYKKLVVERHRKYDFRFNGHVAVFSNNMKEVFVASGACRPEQITITGAPRMDIWLDKRPPVSKDTVTLLSFRTNLFSEIFDSVFSQFMEIARKHPILHFVVKCKEGRDDYWARKAKKRPDIPSNLEFEQHMDLRTLLERSQTIIGANTLALVEALLTDAAVIIPCWGSTSHDSGQLLMDPTDKTLQQEISFCSNLDELNETIEKTLQSERLPDRKCRNEIVNRYMHYTPRETASKRASDLIIRMVKTRDRNA